MIIAITLALALMLLLQSIIFRCPVGICTHSTTESVGLYGRFHIICSMCTKSLILSLMFTLEIKGTRVANHCNVRTPHWATECGAMPQWKRYNPPRYMDCQTIYHHVRQRYWDCSFIWKWSDEALRLAWCRRRDDFRRILRKLLWDVYEARAYSPPCSFKARVTM